MRTTIKSMRNVTFVLLLLLAGTTGPSASASQIDWCSISWYESWSGRCSPGGMDACGYFREECAYYCYMRNGVSTCGGDLLSCEQSNHGSEWDPNYCLDQGYCECHVWD